MGERLTLTGVLRCNRYARLRGRGRITLGSALADMVNPLPDDEVWSLIVPDDSPRGHKTYQLRSQRLPRCLSREMADTEVTVRATVEPFQGTGAGGYMSRVQLVVAGAVGVPAGGPGSDDA